MGLTHDLRIFHDFILCDIIGLVFNDFRPFGMIFLQLFVSNIILQLFMSNIIFSGMLSSEILIDLLVLCQHLF